MIYQINSKIISKKRLSKKHFLISFSSPAIASSAKPGQFVMIRIDDKQTFLRRPFSICGVNNKTFYIVFVVVGIGTKILSQKKVSDTLNIIGPLGSGYPLLPPPYSLFPVFVAGGTGIASLLFLAQYRKYFPLHASRFTIFIGAKTKEDILFENKLKKYRCEVIVSTEDGSYGKKSLITDVFNSQLSTLSTSGGQLPSVVYACGPKPMLKEIAKISKKHNLKCFVSLEERMACGMGVCMGCAIKVRNSEFGVHSKEFEYKRICKDGPVFDAEAIIWD